MVHVWKRFGQSGGTRIHPDGGWHRLEVPPASYIVTRKPRAQQHARAVRPGKATQWTELCIELVGIVLATLADEIPRVTHSDLTAGDLIFSIAGGRIIGEGGGAFGRFNLAGFTGEIPLVYAITDQIYWAAPWPGFGYHFGRHGGFEVFPWLGMYDWGFAFGEEDVPPPFTRPDETSTRIADLHLFAYLGIGVDTRLWINSHASINMMASLTTIAGFGSTDAGVVAPNTLRQNLEVGVSLTLPWLPVTINAGIGAHGNWLAEGDAPRVVAARSSRFDFAMTFGSRLRRSFLHLPLLQMHLNDILSVDMYAWGTYNFPAATWQETYLVGFGAVL